LNDYTKTKLDEVTKSQNVGNKADDDEGGDGHNESNKAIDKTGGGGGNFFRVTGTHHVVPTGHNKIGEENKTNIMKTKLIRSKPPLVKCQ